MSLFFLFFFSFLFFFFFVFLCLGLFLFGFVIYCINWNLYFLAQTGNWNLDQGDGLWVISEKIQTSDRGLTVEDVEFPGILKKEQVEIPGVN